MTIRIFTAGLACLWLVSAATAQNSLQWKFAKGEVFDVERTATEKQTVRLKGKEFKQDRQSAWHVRLEVQDQRADNFMVLATLAKVEQKFTGADAIDPKLSEKMQGSAFTLEVAPSGRIVKLQGYDDFLKRLAGADKDRLKAARVTFPESALNDALADLFGPLPIKDLAWQRTSVEPIAHFGNLRATTNYEYTGTKKGREMIYYTIQTKFETLPKDDKALFQILDGSITAEQARGTIAFNKAAGHLIEHERTMLLRGTFTIETMNRKHLLDFSSENEVRIRVKKGS